MLGLGLGIAMNAQEYSLYQMREVWNSNYLNPGFFPRHEFVLALPSVQTSFNTVGLRNEGLFQYDATAGAIQLNGSIQPSDIDRSWTLRNDVQVDAFGVGARVGRAFISLSTQTRLESRVRFPETFLRTVVEGTADYLNTPLDLGPSWDAIAYQEVSLGLSYAINPRLSVGGRVNRLLGLASFQTQRSALTVTQSDDIYQTTAVLDYQVDYYGAGQFTPIDRTVQGFENFEDAISEDDFEASGETGFRQINQQNNGWSVDLGAEYLLNDRLTLSGAFLNLGSINWKNGTQRVAVSGEVTFEGVDVAELEEDEDYDPIPGLDTVGTFNAVSGEAYRQSLSPRTYIGANYLLSRHVELGGLLFNELGSEGGFTAFSLSGRFTLGRILGLGAVYNLQHRAANSLGANVSLNLGPFQVYGIAEDVTSLLGSSEVEGTNFRAGLNLAFGRKRSEEKLAASRMGGDPFPVGDGAITQPSDPLAEAFEAENGASSADSSATQPPYDRQAAPDASDGREQPGIERESPAEAKSLSLYALKLDLLDETNREAVEMVYMDVYKIDKEGYRTLLRTGRYPKGKVATMLEASKDWHVAKISAYQYDTLEVRFQADPEQTLARQWYMVRQSSGDTLAVDTQAAEKPVIDTAAATSPAEVSDSLQLDAAADKAAEPFPSKQDPPEETVPSATPEDTPSETNPPNQAQVPPQTEPDPLRRTDAPPQTEAPQPDPPAASAPRPQPSDYILTKRTSLREAPDSQSKVISRMPVGTELLLLERTNEWWWRVSMGGWEGYVKAHLLKNKD